MRSPRLKRLTLAAVLVASCALSALDAGCAMNSAGPRQAPAAPLAVSAAGSRVRTRPADATGSATPSGSTSRSSGPAPWAAKLLPPIAGLPDPQPATDITGPRDLGVPILMYHIIGIAPAGAPNPDLYVRQGDFIAQLRYLATNGYHAVTLQQVYDFWHNGGTLPDKPVVLSFDDGDTPDFTVVAPLLNELQWPGVLNLIVGRHKLRFKKPIVRALIKAGWEIDSHTVTHTELPGLSARQLAFEVTGSRKQLQALYHVPVNFFCYPSGRFDAAGVAAVQQAGYLGATTTLGGLARPSQGFLMRRVRVSGGESIASFATLLNQH
ncbi:MAG: polysaccharide deacetylase family protein [Coriobacteriia bacterium]|nr:polysaccharide deacetylase family protein [Coriobacteriia bacterium]